MSRGSRLTMVLLLAVAVLLLAARLRYPGRATVRLPASACDADLWRHVNERQRLQVIETCTVVAGKVVSLHRAADGDLHIALDPDDKSVMNLINVVHGRSTLVIEVICEHSPADADEQAVCGDFHSQVTIPGKGDRVRITGSYVTDRDSGWREIHPVSRIEVLR